MKIVLAPDKFKGSLTAFEFCDAVETGLRNVIPNIKVLRLPLADGGDGTIEIIHHYIQGTFVEVEVSNPFFQTVKARTICILKVGKLLLLRWQKLREPSY